MAMYAKPAEWMWDFDVHYTPGQKFLGAKTFSVSVFQWIPTVDGKHLKRRRGRRVHGYPSNPEAVYAEALRVCDELNGRTSTNEQVAPLFEIKEALVLRENVSVPLDTPVRSGP